MELYENYGMKYPDNNIVGWSDFHIHSTISDGSLSVADVCGLAYRHGIRRMVMTDHDALQDPEQLQQVRNRLPEDITIENGCEISTWYRAKDGRTIELHFTTFFGDLTGNQSLEQILNYNEKVNYEGRLSYVDAMIQRLKQQGIDIGTVEEMLEKYPGSNRIGKKAVASEMYDRGFVSSTREALEEYIGKMGKRKAFVDISDHVRYIPWEQAVEACAGKHIIALAHLNYYGLDDAELREILHRFRHIAGKSAAIETEYQFYLPKHVEKFQAWAEEFDFGCSCGSDFHDSTADQFQQYSGSYYPNLRKRWESL